MALFGSIATLRAQAPQIPDFSVAFDYLEELMLPGSASRIRLQSIELGGTKKIELGGGAFALEQAYETKPRAEGFFESHQKFIDVQVVVEGGELMEVMDLARSRVRAPYAADRDLIIYHDATDASHVRLSAGEAAIFFPADVHMPSLRLHAEPLLVRKSVVKVPAR